METLLASLLLALAGVGAIIGGVVTWRSASRLVADARRTLQAMFGDSFPGIFEGEPDPRGAQIAGVGFVVAGVAFLVVAVVQYWVR